LFRETKLSYDPSPRGELKAAVGEICLDNRAAWIDSLAPPLQGLGDVVRAIVSRLDAQAAMGRGLTPLAGSMRLP